MLLSATGRGDISTGTAILSTGKKIEFKTPIHAASASLSYNFNRNQYSWIPSVRADYIQVQPLDKNSKPLGKGNKDNSAGKTINAQLSIKCTYNIEKDGMQIVPFAEIGILRNIISPRNTWLTSIEGNGAAQWFNSPRNALMLGSGFMFKSNVIDFTAQYTLEKAKDYTSHIRAIKTTIKF